MKIFGSQNEALSTYSPLFRAPALHLQRGDGTEQISGIGWFYSGSYILLGQGLKHTWNKVDFKMILEVTLYNHLHIQGTTKRLRPALVNMRWKNTVLFPAAGRRTQFFLLIPNLAEAFFVVPCTGSIVKDLKWLWFNLFVLTSPGTVASVLSQERSQELWLRHTGLG